MKRLTTFIAVVVIAVCLATGADAALKISGESIWKVGYGSRYYSSYGWKLALGGFLASQELRLDVEGDIIPGLYLEAHVDNTKGDIFQQLTVSLSWEDLWAEAGNIQYVPENILLSRPKATIMGLSAGYSGDQVSAYITAGRSSGRKGSKSFRGATANESIRFTEEGPYLPARREDGLEASIEGLFHAVSGAEFDPAFDMGGIVFSGTSAHGPLADFLEANGLGFLLKSLLNPEGPIEADGFLKNDSVDGLSGVSGAYIILKAAPESLTRSAIVDGVRQYNDLMGLNGDAAKKYPYLPGSPADAAFIEALLQGWTGFATASRSSGEMKAQVPFTSFVRGLVYPIGFSEVIGESMQVYAVAINGTTVPLTAIPGANWICYEDRSYLEMLLPADFTDNYSYVAASFSYRLTAGLYFLGGGIVRGSVTVRLDGETLREGEDFKIEYETGILMILAPIGASQEGLIEVDFEYALTGSKAWMAAAGVTYRPIDDLSFSLEYGYGSDAPYLAEDDTTVSRERSYENVVAAWAEWKIVDKLILSAGASFSSSVFPGEMAQRANAYNLINDISLLEDNTGGLWWVFAHESGASALSPYSGLWIAIDMPGAFAATPVNAAASYSGTWYFATDSGIAALSADYAAYGEEFPGITSLWRTAGTKDGLAASEVTSICLTPASILAGTPVGLLEGPIDMDGPWTLRRQHENPLMGQGAVTGVSRLMGGFVVATESAISYYDGVSFTAIADEGAVELKAASIEEADAVIAATSNGVLIINEELTASRVGSGRQTNSAAGYGGFAYYACIDGLYAYDLATELEVALFEGDMTSVWTDGFEVYAGGRADQLYEIPIARLDYPAGEADRYGKDVHGIDGRDKVHYLPKDAAENTLSGFAGYLSLDYKSDEVDANASMKLRGDGSIAGAGPMKPDGASASLSLEWRPNGSLSLNCLEAFQASGVFGSLGEGGKATLSNTLQAGLSYKGPVNVSALASYVVSKGIGVLPAPQSHSISGSVSSSYSIGWLRLAASLGASYKSVEGFTPFTTASLAASAYLQAGKNTSITISYIEPTPFGSLLSASGNYRSLAGSIRYSAYMTYGNLAANLKGGYKWDVRNEADSADLNVSLTYAARQIELFGFRFLPRSEITLSYLMPIGADSRIVGLVKASAGMSTGVFGADVSLSNKLTYMIESSRLTNSGDASASLYLNGTGWKLRPSLSIGATYNVETPHYGASTSTYKLSAKASLTSTDPVQNQASIGYAFSNAAGGKHDLSVSDSVTFSALEGRMAIGTGINANIGLMASNIGLSAYKASVNGSVGYKFDKSWSARFTAEVGLGAASLYGEPKALYGFELTATLKF